MSIDLDFALDLIHDARESAEAMEDADGGCQDCRNAIEHTDDGHEGHGDNCEVANILDRLEDLQTHLQHNAGPRMHHRTAEVFKWLCAIDDGPVRASDVKVSDSTLRKWLRAGWVEWNDTMAFQSHSFVEATAKGRKVAATLVVVGANNAPKETTP